MDRRLLTVSLPFCLFLFLTVVIVVITLVTAVDFVAVGVTVTRVNLLCYGFLALLLVFLEDSLRLDTGTAVRTVPLLAFGFGRFDRRRIQAAKVRRLPTFVTPAQ